MQKWNGTKCSHFNSFGSRFSKQQPFILLRGTSASKIRCKVSLYVTVKGHWERSTTFTARLHCISGITLLHTIYRLIAQTDGPNTHWAYCYLIDRGVCFDFVKYIYVFFSFLTKKNWMTTHSETALLFQSCFTIELPCLKLQFPGTWL